MPQTTAGSATFTMWVDALDALERELESVLDPEHTSTWVAPEGLAPLPPELLQRAQRILQAQRALSARLDRERQHTARHLAAVNTVPSTAGAGASVYLDTAG